MRIATIVIGVSLLFISSDASAAGRRQQRMMERAQAAEEVPAPQERARPVPQEQHTQAVPKERYRPAPDYSRYPKFIGGFHSREFYDTGVPGGSTGLRGNGLYMYPW